jgi:hypothetical protein
MSKSNSILDINDLLDGYCDDIQTLIQEEAKRIADEGVKELKATSPVNKKNTTKKGSYKRGWRVKNQSGRGHAHYIIHNATNYQLTHLLEKPHATRNGGETRPIVHIKPVDDFVAKEYLRRVENGIKKGGK